MCIRFADDCTHIFSAVANIPWSAINLNLFLQEKFHFFSDHRLFIFSGTNLMQFEHPVAALRLCRFSQLTIHGCRFCSMSSGIFKNMRLIKMNLLYEFIRFFKILFCFLWKSHNHICCKCRYRIKLADQFTFFRILLCTVTAIHIFQSFIASTLQG